MFVDKMKIWLQNNLKGDPVIWIVVLVLSVVSIFVVYSSTGTLAYSKMDGNTEHYLIKHASLMFLSFVAMWGAHKVDYRFYSKLSRYALWLSAILLAITFVTGSAVNDATRWITIPFINQAFQPSDLAKLALITSIASMLSKRQKDMENFKEVILPVVVWVGIICLLIGLADMSTAALLGLTSMLLMFIGRVPLKYFSYLILFISLGLSIAAFSGERLKTVIGRVERFLDDDYVSFQAEQSYIAIATGGIWGKGPGKSEQRNILPHPYSDFIYAIILEEYGIVGGLFILSLYLTLLYRGMRIMANSDKAFGGLLAAGLSFALVLQAMVNMGVAVGLLPVTGLPLPFVSMGGTSLLFTGLSLGIILSVSRANIEEKKGHFNVANNTVSSEPSI